GIAEAHARAVRRILDATVRDAELVEPACPGLELGSVGATEADVVEAGPELAELLVRHRRPVLVHTEERAVSDHVHGVMEVGVGVFVEYRLGTEKRFVPGNADRKIS